MESLRRKSGIVAVAALAAGLVGVLGSTFTPRAPAEPGDGKPGQGKSAPDLTTAEATYTTAALFELGTTQEYDLDESSTLTTTAGQAISTIKLRGPIALTALRERPTVLVRAAFSGTASATVREGEAGPDDALSESARRPFVLEFAMDGHFLRALGTAKVLPMIGRAFTAFGESLQLTRGGAGSKWQSTERDAAGTYTAAYEQPDAYDVWKHKTAYESLDGAKGTYDVLASRADFTLDRGAHLTSFKLGEKLRVTTEGLPGFFGSTELSLKSTRTYVASADLQRFSEEAAQATPLVTTLRDQQEEARDRERIGGMTPADVFGGVQTFTKPNSSKEEKQKAARAFVAMAAMLRRDPTMLDKVKAHLAAKGSDTSVMLAALRDASTPGAQRVLADMSRASSPLDSANRLEAARSLSRVEKPTAETVQALKQMRSDPVVGTQATYGLGSVLHKLKDSDPVLADDARRALQDELAGAKTPYDLVATLTAFGNAGDATLLREIRDRMTSDDPAVRAAAAMALRRIPGPDADALLATLAADPAESVRYRAVQAIGERTPSPTLADALVPLALTDATFDTRSSAVTVLARWLDDLPVLEGTLRKVAASDPHPDVRNTASAALAMNERLARLDATHAGTNASRATR